MLLHRRGMVKGIWSSIKLKMSNMIIQILEPAQFGKVGEDHHTFQFSLGLESTGISNEKKNSPKHVLNILKHIIDGCIIQCNSECNLQCK